MNYKLFQSSITNRKGEIGKKKSDVGRYLNCSLSIDTCMILF